MTANFKERSVIKMLTGYAICGSFCTHADSLSVLDKLIEQGLDIQPIVSDIVYTTDTRFGKCEDLIEKLEDMCSRSVVHTIEDAEVFGPSVHLERLIVSPCTGNTLAKIANGITDTPVCMAVKAHLRSDRPLLIALASNDGLSANLGNISKLLSRKNVYFVPMIQDNPVKKPHSLVADFSLIPECISLMNEGRQLRPIFR